MATESAPVFYASAKGIKMAIKEFAILLFNVGGLR